ncbi:MAG: hypothetical protein Kow0062_28860 [Acidobacteriota bacterium]
MKRKLTTILCNSDLADRVIAALDHAGAHHFLRVPEGVGTMFEPPGRIPRTITWEATMFVVPGLDEEQIDRLVHELRDVVGECSAENCLRILVSNVDRLL